MRSGDFDLLFAAWVWPRLGSRGMRGSALLEGFCSAALSAARMVMQALDVAVGLGYDRFCPVRW